ncbi:MAG: transposase zinc-binding domain-containing protein [Bacteroidales bacterium]|nr:transposase zinc-binding domain-containing protein [Bacteroidales bacterium]
MNSPCELADVVRLFGNELSENEKLKPLQIKVMNKILQCRTAVLGGHKEVCDCCGSVRYRYNSCGDRHCPKCQAAKQAFGLTI